MVRVALTGGIATGKSYVRGRLDALGIPTTDADRIAREVLAPGTPGAAAVRAALGPDVIGADGAVDRAALGRLVFADADARRRLEAIVHPAVYDAIAAWFRGLPPDTPVAVADIPLLFETGREAEFDEVIVVACSPEEQLRRMLLRDALSEEEARARLSAQWPIDEKVRRADAVIWTTGTFAETDAQVEGLVARWRDRQSGA